MEKLQTMHAFWEYAGFSAWQGQGMEGVYRRNTFVKEGFIGKVAEFFADDYILWTHQGLRDEERILKEWKADTDVMKHRFLLLSTVSAPVPRTRSIWLGFGGFVEVLRYRVGSPVPAKYRDLAFLVEKGLEYAVKEAQSSEAVEKGGET